MRLVEKPQAVLEMRGIGKVYGATTALEHVSLSISQGEFIGLIGPNGAGKTTMMEIVEGVNEPTSGAVRIFGEDPLHLAETTRGRIGLVFQRYSLPGYITVLDLANIFRASLGVDPKTDHLMVDLGLVHIQTQRISDLSAGQQQRLAVYVALLGQREFVMLDEPTSALDLRSRQAVWDAILERKSKGSLTGMLATHHLGEAAMLCDRLYFLREGLICEQGPTSEFLDSGTRLSLRFNAPSSFVNGWALLQEEGVELAFGVDRSTLSCPRELIGRAFSEITQAELEYGFAANFELAERSLEKAYMEILNARR